MTKDITDQDAVCASQKTNRLNLLALSGNPKVIRKKPHAIYVVLKAYTQVKLLFTI
jgi:hypothetical protein